MSEAGQYHVPVMLEETVEYLNIKPNGIYVDATMGGGGHTRAILSHLNAEGKLIAFDQDKDAAANVPDDPRVIFIPQNFRHLKRFLRLHKLDKIDGLLADLGVSSFQFDTAERGFSIRFDADLDMRMDQGATQTAADILQNYSEEKLQWIFQEYGEVTNAKTLAAKIVAERDVRPIKTIAELKQALESIVKGNPNRYFAQVFQALRMEVNQEMDVLKEMLEQVPALLETGGRLCVITFHSIEDRVVKQFMKTGSTEEIESDLFGNKPENPLRLVTKKPIEASKDEIEKNNRSRSARLRVAEKK